MLRTREARRVVDFGKLKQAASGAISSALKAGSKDDVVAAQFSATMTAHGYVATKTKEKDLGDHHILHFQPARPGGRFEKVEIKVRRKGPAVAGIKLPGLAKVGVVILAFPSSGGAAKLGLGGQKHEFQVDADRLVTNDLQPTRELSAQIEQRLRGAGIIA
jgi:hypothetical protein